ncbi:nucleoside 2-deoxyribosyltransferase [Pediococcus pentosaceus]|uniref:nucleoside 2-deoxyribosyltransferase n=1 Tax=Pediococcus pentosaceus TaxID=1255 RepID=UPI0018FF0E99|nr:nucleoside 2-deoxyribosyltransferase [Pediococcus pentosaceus]MBF7131594.1 nucleoside 2-deoxyribosyltransferase [Pediococcus pentosaceus]
MSKNIYLAAPFFDEIQKARIDAVHMGLKANKTVGSIYKPENHQMESEELYSLPWQVGVFKQDVRQVETSDVVVAILDYVEVDDEIISDPGTIFEVGAAFEAGVPVVMVQFGETSQFNLMLAQSGTAYFQGEDIQKLKDYDFQNLPQNFTNQPVF